MNHGFVEFSGVPEGPRWDLLTVQCDPTRILGHAAEKESANAPPNPVKFRN